MAEKPQALAETSNAQEQTKEHEPEPKSFTPKTPVELAPPKYDPISYEELSKCDGRPPLPRSFPPVDSACLSSYHTIPLTHSPWGDK